MTAAHIHQIYYSPTTREQLDPGFIPLDNLANTRPDWREYWPIRRYLLENPPEGDEFIGFFSPKFGEKTGLNAATVQEFIARQPDDTDVILLSPFFDQIAGYWNIFEHGMSHHPGIFDTFKLAANELLPGVVLEAITTDSRNTVFSNFFVANPLSGNGGSRKTKSFLPLLKKITTTSPQDSKRQCVTAMLKCRRKFS